MPTLQDLMATIQGGQGRPGQGNLLAALAPLMGGGGGTAPPPVGMSNTDAQIQAAIDARGIPDPVVQEPVPQQSKLWQRLIAGIADAGSVYARGLNPYVPTTSTLGYLLGQDQAATDTATRNKARLTEAELAAKNRKGEAQLQYLLGKQQTEQRAADKLEARTQHEKDLAAAAALKREEDAQRAADKARELALEQERFQWQKKVDQSLIDSRYNRAEEIKAADKKDFQNELSILDETVNGTGNGDSLKELLDAGKITVDQMERIALRRIKYSTLPGPLKEKYAEAAKEILGPVLAEHRMNMDLAAGSPKPQIGPGYQIDQAARDAFIQANPSEAANPAAFLGAPMPAVGTPILRSQRDRGR